MNQEIKSPIEHAIRSSANIYLSSYCALRYNVFCRQLARYILLLSYSRCVLYSLLPTLCRCDSFSSYVACPYKLVQPYWKRFVYMFARHLMYRVQLANQLPDQKLRPQCIHNLLITIRLQTSNPDIPFSRLHIPILVIEASIVYIVNKKTIILSEQSYESSRPEQRIILT